LSFNHYSALPRPFDEWFEATQSAGVTAIGLNRQRVEEAGYSRVLKLVRKSGVKVTTYASLGYWASGTDPEGRPRTLADNLRNLDQAAELGVEVVSVTSGGLRPGDKDLNGARERVVEGLAELIPHAVDRKLKLGLEPLHPMFAPSLGILLTLSETMDLIDRLQSECLGIIFDVFHSWWEPKLSDELKRASDRIFLVQLNDWVPHLIASSPFNPPTGIATSSFNRGLMGEGVIDFAVILRDLTDYNGWFDVEATNHELRTIPMPDVLAKVAESYKKTIEPLLR
jgi:sugar phosphate isomerase/epimerase